jgi:2C-methyl-D-erythritol 2,4-cyclodiphosphate synthase
MMCLIGQGSDTHELAEISKTTIILGGFSLKTN